MQSATQERDLTWSPEAELGVPDEWDLVGGRRITSHLLTGSNMFTSMTQGSLATAATL